jgi:hypothetical protein
MPAYSAANEIVLTEHKEHYDLRALSQAVITTADYCTHKDADKADVGIVAQCRNQLWRTNCVAVTRRGAADKLCAWNPYYFSNLPYTQGSWNRMRGRKLAASVGHV